METEHDRNVGHASCSHGRGGRVDMLVEGVCEDVLRCVSWV
ncbi:MAG: hypothetical protein ACTS4U_02010 [Candidatus Hodgkinia cicadicola]